jgi:hypothetical protein
LKRWAIEAFLEVLLLLQGTCDDPPIGCPEIVDATALLIEHGPAAMASALATLMNHAMQIG